jgi:hypothetical protein
MRCERCTARRPESRDGRDTRAFRQGAAFGQTHRPGDPRAPDRRARPHPLPVTPRIHPPPTVEPPVCKSCCGCLPVGAQLGVDGPGPSPAKPPSHSTQNGRPVPRTAVLLRALCGCRTYSVVAPISAEPALSGILVRMPWALQAARLSGPVSRLSGAAGGVPGRIGDGSGPTGPSSNSSGLSGCAASHAAL